MKRTFIFVMLILALAGMVTASNTISYPRDSGKLGRLAAIFNDDLVAASITAKPTYGILDRIVITSTGTDTSYGVVLKDDNGATLFTKADCNSVNEPYSYALTQSDLTSGILTGVYVSGPLTFSVSNVSYVSEYQTVSIPEANIAPDAGHYHISYDGVASGEIAYGATTSAIDTAVEAISTVGAGNIAAVAGTALSSGHNIVLTATGTFASTNLSAFTIDTSALVDTGNNETQTIAQASTAAKGHWHITYGAITTGPIAWDAAKSGIDTALDAAFGTGVIVSTATGGIAANNVVLTFSGTGVTKTDVEFAAPVSADLLTAADAPVTLILTESLKGKADIIPTATVTETPIVYGLSNLNVIVYYRPVGD